MFKIYHSYTDDDCFNWAGPAPIELNWTGLHCIALDWIAPPHSIHASSTSSHSHSHSHHITSPLLLSLPSPIKKEKLRHHILTSTPPFLLYSPARSQTNHSPSTASSTQVPAKLTSSTSPSAPPSMTSSTATMAPSSHTAKLAPVNHTP